MKRLHYYTVAEFASLFNVSTSTIYKLISENIIPAITVGHRNYRIAAKTVEEIESSGLFGDR